MTHLLLLSALVLSAIAAFYAVAGLVAIFAAAATSIIIMGAALEISKLVVASWLYRNWSEIPFLLKTYFTTALVILMMLTSMGIFGYLSKAHLDQAVPTGDIVSKLNLIDEKITTQRENIDASRKQIAQLDSIAEQAVSRTEDARGIERANQIRRSQARERTKLFSEIEVSQTEIANLNQERSPIAAEVRKVEAKVGPIKYIAALLYGDELNDTLLEQSVRIVIIMIVLVFDPLAVLMLIAWSREQKRNKDPLDDPEVKAFFERGKVVARALDEQADLPEEVKKDIGLVADDPVPEQTFEDWHEKLYERAVPKKTEDFLNTVEKIKEEPVAQKPQVNQPAPVVKEDEFTLNSDITEILEKPTNGRPEKYK